MTIVSETARAADAAQSAAKAANRAAGQAANAAGTATMRVPANLMALVRQSYDSREKVLDWILAFCVVGVLAYTFQDQLRTMMMRPWGDPNAGRTDPPEPSMDVADAFPVQRARANLYTYNMPAARNFKYGTDTSNGTRPPLDPSTAPDYSVLAQETP